MKVKCYCGKEKNISVNNQMMIISTNLDCDKCGRNLTNINDMFPNGV